jgi:hypothetical protein
MNKLNERNQRFFQCKLLITEERNQRRHQKMERSLYACENGYSIKSNLHFQCNPYQNSNDILHGDRKINPKIHMKTQNTSNSQSNFEQKSNAGGI